MADDEKVIYKKRRKPGCFHSFITWMLSPRPRKPSDLEKTIAAKDKEQDEACERENQALLISVLFSSIRVVKEEKTMSHSRFFKGFVTGAATTVAAGGAVGYATGVITIKNAAIVFAGSVGLSAAAPWLAVGLVGTTLMYHCYQRYQAKNELADEEDYDAWLAFPDEKCETSNRFFKGFVTGAATTVAAGGTIGYATGVMTIKSGAVLFAGSVGLSSVAPWLALGLALLTLYYAYSRRSTKEVVGHSQFPQHLSPESDEDDDKPTWKPYGDDEYDIGPLRYDGRGEGWGCFRFRCLGGWGK
jgi:hypothetical protein